MAGQAAKKLSKSAAETINYYFYAGVVAAVLHVSLGGLLRYHTITKIEIFGSVLLICISRFTYSSIAYALELGIPYSWYQDIFLVNVAVQVLSLASNYFWLLYLLIPGYAAYIFGGMFFNWIFTPSLDESDPAYLKKKEKLERRAARQGGVRVKR